MKNDFPPNTLSHSSLVVCTEKIFWGKIQGNPTLEDTCLKQCYYNTIQTTNFISDYGYLRIMISLGWISKGRKICAAVKANFKLAQKRKRGLKKCVGGSGGEKKVFVGGGGRENVWGGIVVGARKRKHDT